jgi:hypothetical protein
MSKRKRMPKSVAAAKAKIETAASNAIDWLEPLREVKGMSEIERLHRISRAIECQYKTLQAVSEIKVEGETP